MIKVPMKRFRDDGFSLVEMLVAISILAVGLLGMAALQGTAIRGNAFGMRNTEAVALIEDKIEEYKNTPYANIAEGSTTETNLGTSGIFTRTTTVQKDVPVNDTKTLTVQISWSDPTSHTFSFQTIISKES
ncbi:MAG: prepilin-type N-terminal cleavage/methylation domain-containing protein [Pseudomonadota bacterium]